VCMCAASVGGLCGRYTVRERFDVSGQITLLVELLFTMPRAASFSGDGIGTQLPHLPH